MAVACHGFSRTSGSRHRTSDSWESSVLYTAGTEGQSPYEVITLYHRAIKQIRGDFDLHHDDYLDIHEPEFTTAHRAYSDDWGRPEEAPLNQSVEGLRAPSEQAVRALMEAPSDGAAAAILTSRKKSGRA